MESLVGELANYGVLGIVCIVQIYGISRLYKRNCEMGDRIIKIVENNTESMNGLKNSIEKLSEHI